MMKRKAVNDRSAGRRLVLTCAVAATMCSALHAAAGDDPPVQVIVDMDTAAPEMQPGVMREAHPVVTHEVEVWIIDPLGSRTMYSIGYIGGINRGISLGHTPTATHAGQVTAMTGALGAPVHPDNWAEVIPTAWLDPAFAGPEVQYVEGGAMTPATIPAAPSAPVFTATITIENPLPGDMYFFYLLDFPAIWAPGGGGAFSTQSELITLDTGGDVVPDQTVCAYGVDLDVSIPVPPASFLVNYIDGANVGGATIYMTQATGDINADGVVNVDDLLALLAAWGPCPGCPEDLDGDGVVDVIDLLLLLGNWS